MKTYLAGEDLALKIPLRMYGEPVVPDSGSVKFSLRDNSGQVVIAKEPVIQPAASTEAAVLIPAANNALGASRFSMRTVIVEFTKTGRPQSTHLTYRLTAWLNTSVTPGDVRAFCGLDSGELPDAVIDIVEAYLDIENDVGEEVLTAALAGERGGAAQISANRLVLAKAVLLQIPGLALRVSQNESNGVFSAQRAKIDLTALEARAQGLYADNSIVVAGRLEVDQDLFLAPALAPDPLTGA